MGLWHYEASSSSDDDTDSAVLRSKQDSYCPEQHEMQTRKRSRPASAGNKSLVDLASSDDEWGEDTKPAAVAEIDLDEIEAEMSLPKKSKRGATQGKSPAKGKGKSPGKGKGKSPGKGKSSCSGDDKQEAERLQRIEAMRKKARDAFAADNDDDDDEDDIECSDLPSAPAATRLRARVPAKPEDEEADIEAQLEKERLEMLQNAQGTGTEAPEGETYVLKVSCKHGSVQIRQGKSDNFVTLHAKFQKYAMEQQWAKASTKLHLQCDDEDVDLEKHTPDDFDLEDNMIIDVVMK